jgi:hypothetical protein
MTGAGEVTNAAALDAAVLTNRAGLFTSQCTSASGAPPNSASLAVWANAGYYLQTRPTQNAGTLLLATFTNKTTLNATRIHINYEFTTNRATIGTEEVRGHRVYYSLTGLANSWTNLAALSQAPAGVLSVDLDLNGMWMIDAPFYLLWADDNGTASPDDALDIDNFALQVVDGVAQSASCTLSTPGNGQAFSAPATVALAAFASPGPEGSITGVGFYERDSGWLASDTNAPYTGSVSLLPGTYSLYAVATNSLGAILFFRHQYHHGFQCPAGGRAHGAGRRTELFGGGAGFRRRHGLRRTVPLCVCGLLPCRERQRRLAGARSGRFSRVFGIAGGAGGRELPGVCRGV